MLPLILEEVSQPEVAPQEVLVRIHAVGVTPTELIWYPTTHAKSGEKRTRAIPGHEFSGTVVDIGAQAGGVAGGQEVYGMNDWFAEGATAEYCVTRPEWIAPKPRRLSHAEAASVPISALTAWQGLLGRAKLQSGERVLIHGGSGAVGVFAIQLARRQGAHIITTASARNKEFLLQLGADQVIDYRTERFEKLVNGIDVVFDTVGRTTLERSWDILGPRGRLVTITAGGEGTKDERTKNAFFIVEPNRQQLSTIGDLLESGELQPVVDAIVPFAQAGDAFAGPLKNRAGRGKAVIAVAE